MVIERTIDGIIFGVIILFFLCAVWTVLVSGAVGGGVGVILALGVFFCTVGCCRRKRMHRAPLPEPEHQAP